MIEISRGKHITSNTKLIVHKWLDMTSGKINNYNIKILNKSDQDYGYVYCITSKICNGIKIGYWKGTIESLRKRYITYYGNSLELFYVYTKFPRILEKKCFDNFIRFKIDNEIFEKENYDYYKEFLLNNIM